MVSGKYAFIVDVTGNALDRIQKLTGQSSRLGKAVAGVRGAFAKLGSIATPLNQAVQLVGTVAAKMREFTEANRAQQEAEAKLARVMHNTMGASAAEVQSIKNLATAQQRLGVIGDEVQLAGAQELGTYLSKADSLKTLMPVMNDMLAQQYGLNASQEQAAQIGSMLGKVMDGQVGALSRYGYKFDEAQEKILKYGTEEQRVAVLADVVGSAVGGMNEALAQTPEGRMQQLKNIWGDMKERIGGAAVRIGTAFLPTLKRITDAAQGVLDKLMPHVEAAAKGVQAALSFIHQNVMVPIRDLLGGILSDTDGWRAHLEPVISAFRDHVLPAVKNVLANIFRLVGGIIDFVKNSYIVQDTFKVIMAIAGKLWEIVSGVVNLFVNLFSNVIKPILNAVDKLYGKLMKKGRKQQQAAGSTSTGSGSAAATAGVVTGLGTASLPTAGKAPQAARQGAQATVTGGTRSTTINISLGKMIEQIVFNGTFEEGVSTMEQRVQEALLRVLYAAEGAAV